MIKHISFDLWLTLIKSNPLYKQRRAELIAQRYNPKDLSIETVSELIKKCDRACDKLNERTGKKLPTELMYRTILKRLGHSMDSISSNNLFEMKMRMNVLFFEFPPSLLNNGIVEMVKQLKREGYTLNLSSNTGFIEGKYLLRCETLIELLGLFDFRVFSDEINASKPSVHFYDEVFRQITVNKDEVLHVGDNLKADFHGAQSYGFHALLIEQRDYTIQQIKDKIDETNR